MLKKETLDKIKGFGFDTDKLIEAIKADAETDYEVPEVQVFTTDELTTLTTNTKAEGKRDGVAEGKAAGLEIAGKQIAKKFSLPATVDTKKLDTVIDAAAAMQASGDEGLKEQVRLLQLDKETLTKEKETLSTEKDAVAFDSTLISYFPTKRNADLSDSERLMLVKGALKFETEDGKAVVKKDGVIMRDPKTQEPIAQKDAIAAMFTERKWAEVEPAGGRGGGDATGGGAGGKTGIKKISEAQEKWKAANPGGNIISPECTAFVADIAKESTDFDWYN